VKDEEHPVQEIGVVLLPVQVEHPSFDPQFKLQVPFT
jgi:hypothetical protein